jgi:hypothetical protein
MATTQGGEKTWRRLVHQPGRSIPQQLLDSDVGVMVQKHREPGLLIEPPRGETWLAWRTGFFSMIFTFTVTSADSRLTAAEDWVETSVTGRVVDVFKCAAGCAVRVGDAVGLNLDGGDVTVRGRSVKAFVSWLRPLARGQMYLAFSRSVDKETGRPVISYDTTFEVTSLGLVGITTAHNEPTISGRRLADVVREMKDIMNR